MNFDPKWKFFSFIKFPFCCLTHTYTTVRPQSVSPTYQYNLFRKGRRINPSTSTQILSPPTVGQYGTALGSQELQGIMDSNCLCMNLWWPFTHFFQKVLCPKIIDSYFVLLASKRTPHSPEFPFYHMGHHCSWTLSGFSSSWPFIIRYPRTLNSASFLLCSQSFPWCFHPVSRS